MTELSNFTPTAIIWLKSHFIRYPSLRETAGVLARSDAGGGPPTVPRARKGVAGCAAITMFHVLEHLYEPASYLDAAHKLLRPDGRLVVQVPNAACWQFLLFGERWNGIDVPRQTEARGSEPVVEPPSAAPRPQAAPAAQVTRQPAPAASLDAPAASVPKTK